MPKKAKQPRRTGKRSAPMTAGMKLFLAGCAAELYLLAVRRFYVNGTLNQVVAWYDALPFLGLAGIIICLAGGAWWYTVRTKPGFRSAAASVFVVGLCVAAASFLAWWSQPSVNLMCVAVPAAMLLCVFWSLYDRSCALSLTVLSISIMAAWVCSRTSYQSSPYYSTVRTLAAVYMALLAVMALLIWRGKLGFVLPARADPLPVYLACALSAAAIVPSLLNAAAAYYAMWVLALIAFGLVVFYTVKQL